MAIENIGLVAVTEHAAKKVAVKHGGKIKAVAGTKYLLQVDGSDVAPENVTVKRDGKDLEVFFEGSKEPDLTIQNFFAEGMDSQLYGVAEDGQLYAYVRTDGEGFYGHLLMSDGESAPIALGGDALGNGAPYLASTFDDAAGFVLWPWLLGLAGIGAAAAVIDHNRGGDSKHHTTPTSAEPSNVKVIDDVGPIQGQLANGDGYAVVGGLTPYRQNDIEIDPKGTSQDVELQVTQQSTAPRYGSVVMLKYPTVSGAPVLMTVVRDDGEVIPLGAEVLDAKGNSLSMVGQGGRIFLRGVEAKGELLVSWGEGSGQRCRVAYQLPENPSKDAPFVKAEATCRAVLDKPQVAQR